MSVVLMLHLRTDNPPANQYASFPILHRKRFVLPGSNDAVLISQALQNAAPHRSTGNAFGQKPLFIVDGAHNPAGAQALVQTLRQHFSERKITGNAFAIPPVLLSAVDQSQPDNCV